MIGWLTVWLGIFAWLLFVVQADPNERGKLERHPWRTLAILAAWPVVYPVAFVILAVGAILAAREGKTLREWMDR